MTGAAAALAGLPRRAAAQRPSQGRPKIDIHVHLGRDRREMGELTKEKLPAAVKYLVGEMDRHGVGKSLIVPVEPQFPTDLYLEAAKLEPERLLSACSVLPRPANQAIDKLKAYRDRGAKALKLQPAQYDPQDPAVERVVAEAVRLGMPVLFHHTDLPKSFPDMLGRLANTFPDGNFVVVHFGGVYGFWDVLPLARLPNVYLETSTAFSRLVRSPLKSMLHFLVAENRLDRLIFGSELPGDYEEVFAAIDELLGPGAKEDVVKAIYKSNADRILKLTISAQQETQENERERTQKLTELFTTLGVKPGARVAEVGAGGGFYITRLSRAVGASGRVTAVDISESVLKRLRRRLEEDEISNVEVIQGEVKDPKLAVASQDGILISDAYHEMTEYQAVLAGVKAALKPGAKLVILDRGRRSERGEADQRPREKQTPEHMIARELVEQELAQAGFEIVERRDPFIERASGDQNNIYWWLLVARRAS